MSSPVSQAFVFPSKAALDQTLAEMTRESPGGFLLKPPFYTFDSLLPAVLEQTPLPEGCAPLSPQAGPMLLQAILRKAKDHEDLFAGMAKGRRFPDRLWRLLVEIKAAGLLPEQIRELEQADSGGRFLALTELLELYQKRLDDLGLADQADRLKHLEASLEKGFRPKLISSWRKLEALEVLWLRTLDLGLLRALSKAIKVRVNFSLLPPDDEGPVRLFKLLKATERHIIENMSQVEINWHEIEEFKGPLAPLVQARLGGETAPLSEDFEDCLEVLKAPGRYTEMEDLVIRAGDLLNSGVPPQKLAIVLTDPDIQGQMALNVAQRMGISLDWSPSLPLTATPVCRAFLLLLELPLKSFLRKKLIQAFESPYLFPALAPLIWENDPLPASRIKSLLSSAGYFDAAENEPLFYLQSAYHRLGEGAETAVYLGQSLEKLKALLEEFSSPGNLHSYLREVQELWRKLKIGQHLFFGLNPENKKESQTIIQDMAALGAMDQALEELVLAASQIEDVDQLSATRLLAGFRHMLAQYQVHPLKKGPMGIRLVSLDQAGALDLDYAFVAGLNLGDFPLKPQARHFLGGQDLVRLGIKAKAPVWRTDEEEYSGQILNLLRLLAKTRHKVILSHAAADASGQEKEPALELTVIASLGGVEISRANGGVYGSLPGLEQCHDPLGLWAGLTRGLLNPLAFEQENHLAREVFTCLSEQDPYFIPKWRDIRARVMIEARRKELNRLDLKERPLNSDAYSGSLNSSQIIGRIRELLTGSQSRPQSASSFEQYAACPMAWFYGRILGLTPQDEPELDLKPSDEGSWVHEALRLFFEPEEYDHNWSDQTRRQRINDCLEQARAEQKAGGNKGHDRLAEARKPVLKKALAKVVELECREMGEARPRGVELSFGSKKNPFEIKVPGWPDLRLAGRVDRLDKGPDFIRIVDYKHTSNDAGLRNAVCREEWGVSAFQLPIYLAFAACQAPEPALRLLARLTPTRKWFESEKLRKPVELLADDPFLNREPVLSDQEEQPINLYQALAGLWKNMLNGRFFALPDKQTCLYCDFKRICRAESHAGEDNNG
ncbi:PD-(D/E)XK nuclease family protein [Dethiosulfatarculus sandiegensis]|uniref:PD-(D/E)XK endonuclease-like domain-containing protein n=1 Tax=Dethiosulfatarculus sandiegensis TaxID=1429043 RepID=A0A0D2JEL3_9BACT|nr:PD-(D/E)XK nuclease family protein [Dethiosulfatarculus sandiegensis]KIX14076.1 hypothetical protein X474_10605 [Dethiosulfatarculus sandiegensis]